jgi:hypothetical protein
MTGTPSPPFKQHRAYLCIPEVEAASDTMGAGGAGGVVATADAPPSYSLQIQKDSLFKMCYLSGSPFFDLTID